MHRGSTQVRYLPAAASHLTGCVLTIGLLVNVTLPGEAPSTAGNGSAGLAAAYLMFFALLQVIVHNSIAFMRRRRLATAPSWRPVTASLATGVLAIFACYATLHMLPHDDWVERLSATALTTLVMLPGFMISWAALSWASRSPDSIDRPRPAV